MNEAQQFQMLGRKQLAIQEGITLLQRIQLELAGTAANAKGWGNVAIFANLTLIPLNVIVNSFELKAANTAYQLLVRQLYDHFSKSGTRVEGTAKTALSLLKKAIVEALKGKGLSEFVPGVNILVGLAEDSLAAWQAIQLVEGGKSEITARVLDLQRKIAAANKQLVALGIKRAEMLERMRVYGRTA